MKGAHPWKCLPRTGKPVVRSFIEGANRIEHLPPCPGFRRNRAEGVPSRVKYGIWTSGKMTVNCAFQALYFLIGQNNLSRNGFWKREGNHRDTESTEGADPQAAAGCFMGSGIRSDRCDEFGRARAETQRRLKKEDTGIRGEQSCSDRKRLVGIDETRRGH